MQEIYRQRLTDRNATAAVLRRQELLFSYVRIAVFAGGLVLAWLTLFADVLSPVWLAVPALAFLVAVVLHDVRVRRRLRAATPVVASPAASGARPGARRSGTAGGPPSPSSTTSSMGRSAGW